MAVVQLQRGVDHFNTDELQVKHKPRLPKGSDYFDAGEVAAGNESRVHMFESTEEVNRFVEYFLNKRDYRTAFFVVLGCNTALRPEDLLEYRWRNVFDGDQIKSLHSKMERKTQKSRIVVLNDAVSEMAWLYRKSLGCDYDPDKFCFSSRGGNVCHTPLDWRKDKKEDRIYSIEAQPLNVRSMSRVLRGAAKNLGMYREDRRIACYSLRKTALNAPTGLISGIERSAELHEMLKSAEVSQMLANHASIDTTQNHYLDIKNRVMLRTFKTMNFGLEAIKRHKEDIGLGC